MIPRLRLHRRLTLHLHHMHLFMEYLNTVPLRPIRFSESLFHRPEAAEKKFVSYIPFLIWVDLVSRLHAIRFTRLHETKLCLRLRACRQVCKFIVGKSKRMVTARAATPTHVAPTHAAAPTQCCRRATRRPPMPQPRATFILLATTSCLQPACLPCALATCRCSRSLARCSSRNHLARGSGLKKFKSWSSPAAPA